MIDGIYSGAAALDTLARQQELIASNLMHANSSAHRRIQAGVKQRFEVDHLDVNLDLGPEIETYKTDFTPGRQVHTGRPLDVSIAGDGFLIFDNDGQEYLARNGRLYRDPDSNLLVSEEGFPIQGESGPITIQSNIADQDLTIASDGTISANGNVLGKIKTVAFQDNQTLIPVGIAEFLPGKNSVESDRTVEVMQFRHELSNVQPVAELVALIVNTRQYEAVQKATRAISDSLREHIRG